MDNLKKQLTAVKKAHGDMQFALNNVYKEFGALQFEYALHSTEPIPHIAAQDFAMWKSLRESRQYDAETILNIKTAQSRQSELIVFYGEIDTLWREQQRKYEKMRHAFILQFFQTYRENSLPCIMHIRTEIEPLETALKEWEAKYLELEKQKHDSTFFKKLTLEPQLLSIKRKLYGVQKQRDEQIITIGDSVLTDDVLAEVRGECFPDSLEAVYSDLVSIAVKQNEIEARKDTLTAEQQKLDETLAECGAKNSPQKRIAVLTAQIKKTDEALEHAERCQGILYGDVFYTSNGTKIEAALSDPPDSFQPYLNSIAEYRMKLEKNRLNREYIENQIAIAAEAHKVDILQKAIADYKEGIAQYERLISTAEQDMAQSETRSAALEKTNRELFPQFSADVC